MAEATRATGSGSAPEHDRLVSLHRRITLTAHVVTSVGWLGAVAASLALAVVALTSDDVDVVGVAYPAMELIAQYVLIPLSIASLLTGIVQSVTTRWGLVRHHWVVMKLGITVLSVVILLAYAQTLGGLAEVSRQEAVRGDDLDELRSGSAALHAGGGLALLLAATVLSVFKPRGVTRYGQRRQRHDRARTTPS